MSRGGLLHSALSRYFSHWDMKDGCSSATGGWVACGLSRYPAMLTPDASPGNSQPWKKGASFPSQNASKHRHSRGCTARALVCKMHMGRRKALLLLPWVCRYKKLKGASQRLSFWRAKNKSFGGCSNWVSESIDACEGRLICNCFSTSLCSTMHV